MSRGEAFLARHLSVLQMLSTAWHAQPNDTAEVHLYSANLLSCLADDSSAESTSGRTEDDGWFMDFLGMSLRYLQVHLP